MKKVMVVGLRGTAVILAVICMTTVVSAEDFGGIADSSGSSTGSLQSVASESGAWLQSSQAMAGAPAEQTVEENSVAGDIPESSELNTALQGDYKQVVLAGIDFADKYDVKSALVCWDHALSEQPDDGRVWLLKGVALTTNHMYDEAFDAYDTALAKDNVKNDSELTAIAQTGVAFTYVDLAVSHDLEQVKYDNYKVAIQYCNYALEADPSYGQAYAVKGKAYDGLRQTNEAIACFDKALELNPNDYASMEDKADTLNKLGRYDEAIAYCEKAKTIKSISFSADRIKGEALYWKGQNAEAIACFDAALEANPDPGNAKLMYTDKGMALAASGNFAEAVNNFDQALQIDVNNPEAWYEKGLALKNMGKIDDAKACFANVQVKPGVIYYQLAQLELRKQKNDSSPSGASRNLTVIGMSGTNGNPTEEIPVSSSPAQDSPGLTQQGIGEEQKGYYTDAVKYYDQALALDNNNQQAWAHKGMSLMMLEDYQSAVQCLDNATNLNSADGISWANKGLALYMQGKYTESIAAYDQALKTMGDSSQLWDYKGIALEESGDSAGAVVCYQKVTALALSGDGLAEHAQQRITALEQPRIAPQPERGNTWSIQSFIDKTINSIRRIIGI